MKGARPRWRPAGGCLEPAAGMVVRRLTDRSLLLYLLVVVADRAWLVLNTDVQDLLRRMH
jgi:hypothetical protein